MSNSKLETIEKIASKGKAFVDDLAAYFKSSEYKQTIKLDTSSHVHVPSNEAAQMNPTNGAKEGNDYIEQVSISYDESKMPEKYKVPEPKFDPKNAQGLADIKKPKDYKPEYRDPAYKQFTKSELGNKEPDKPTGKLELTFGPKDDNGESNFGLSKQLLQMEEQSGQENQGEGEKPKQEYKLEKLFDEKYGQRYVNCITFKNCNILGTGAFDLDRDNADPLKTHIEFIFQDIEYFAPPAIETKTPDEAKQTGQPDTKQAIVNKK